MHRMENFKTLHALYRLSVQRSRCVLDKKHTQTLLYNDVIHSGCHDNDNKTNVTIRVTDLYKYWTADTCNEGEADLMDIDIRGYETSPTRSVTSPFMKYLWRTIFIERRC